MRHADRCIFWTRPKDTADMENSLHDAAVSLPPGKMLVYRQGMPVHVSDMYVSAVAMQVATKLGLALVQWPARAKTCANDVRNWLYALQRPGPPKAAPVCPRCARGYTSPADLPQFTTRRA